MGNRHRIIYEIRLTQSCTTGFWGLEFVCRSTETVEKTEDDTELSETGLRGIETESRFVVVLARMPEHAQYEPIRRVLPQDRLVRINGDEVGTFLFRMYVRTWHGNVMYMHR